MTLFALSCWLLLGLLLGSVLLIYARSREHKVEKRVLARGLIVVAIIYVVFALLSGDFEWIVIELIGIPVYGLFYYLALRQSLYWLAAGWAAHPLWDALLHLQGPGSTIAPEWYVVTCISFDLLVAVYVVQVARRA